MFNEFFVRDTSRKIKSVFKAKGMTGKHLTGTVIYGYLWADEKRERWIVDEEAAAIVRRIFAIDDGRPRPVPDCPAVNRRQGGNPCRPFGAAR
jgi:DNA invertase Pin-like site-specific DNA recombinase